MAIAHIGVGLLTLGVTITQTYRLEQDISLRPGESQTLRGYRFEFKGTRRVEGPNYTATESEVEISRDGKRVAVLHPQKRTYRVQQSPMTEAGIEVDWNRDLFVAMGEDLGDGAWSMRLQYKPLVRFIWLGALVMALGGLIAITDRRYRTVRAAETEPVRGAAPAR
jgi:cytochrome c-type biogenesis protein CcmF